MEPKHGLRFVSVMENTHICIKLIIWAYDGGFLGILRDSTKLTLPKQKATIPGQNLLHCKSKVGRFSLRNCMNEVTKRRHPNNQWDVLIQETYIYIPWKLKQIYQDPSRAGGERVFSKWYSLPSIWMVSKYSDIHRWAEKTNISRDPCHSAYRGPMNSISAFRSFPSNSLLPSNFATQVSSDQKIKPLQTTTSVNCRCCRLIEGDWGNRWGSMCKHEVLSA